MSDKPEAEVFKVHLSGNEDQMGAFLRAHPMEVYAVKQDARSVDLDVYITKADVAAAQAAGLQVRVIFNATAQTQKLAIGSGNRFAGGAIPQGIGLRR